MMNTPDSSTAPRVDASLNVFAKPYQTALSVLSLLQFSGKHIDRIYMQFEPMGSRYDKVPPYAVAEYLGDRVVVTQPEYWLECDPADLSRLDDPAYRFSIRYEYAFEATDKPYLFVLHNDVLIKKDIVGAMLEAADGVFAVGLIGQCWNCPASRPELVKAAGLGDKACDGSRYMDFRPDFDGLVRLYEAAREAGTAVRPWWEGWEPHYAQQAWPLPECRVNEWGCLVDIHRTRELVMPFGGILPFGAYEPCGSECLDIDVSWFRELSRSGLKARHFDIDPYLKHFVGNNRMTPTRHREAEEQARVLLLKHFQPFVNWCRERRNGMFD